ILLAGIDFLFGECGIPTLGHAGFVAIGGIVTAWLYSGELGYPVPFLVALIAGGMISAFIGVILALPSVRIKDHHLTVVTLAFGMLVPLLFKSRHMEWLSKFSAGGIQVNSIALPQFLKWMPSESGSYYMTLLVFFVLMTFAFNLRRRS